MYPTKFSFWNGPRLQRIKNVRTFAQQISQLNKNK